MAMPNDTFTDYDTLLEARATTLAKQAAPPQQEKLPTYGYSELVERRTRRESDQQASSSVSKKQTNAVSQVKPSDKRKMSITGLFKRKGSNAANIATGTTTTTS